MEKILNIIIFLCLYDHYYLFLLFFRICHPHDGVWNILNNALVKTFLNFPQHGFWHMVALLKSKDSKRTIRCDQIFQKVLSSPHGEVINDSRRLTGNIVFLREILKQQQNPIIENFTCKID